MPGLTGGWAPDSADRHGCESSPHCVGPKCGLVDRPRRVRTSL
jgi:hypothetical protein